MKAFFLASTLLALGSLNVTWTSDAVTVNPHPVATQPAEPGAGHVGLLTSEATATCAFTFTSGANENFLKFCVTANGNVVQLETPQGHEHIAHGVPGEGYGFCDINTHTEYFDYSFFGDSPNWGEPTVVNQNATSVRIARTTLDGIWTLTQIFTHVAGISPFAKVEMTLRNNSTIDRTVFLMRYADVEPDHLFTSSMGASSNSAFAWDQTVFASIGLRGNFGLLLQGIALPQQHSPDLGPQGFIEDNAFSDPPAPCNPYKNFISGTPPESKGSLVMIYQLGIPKKGAKAVTINYKGI